MKNKVIIFDFDGVICDSVNVKTEAFIELYKSYNKSIQDKVKNYHLEHGGISRFEKIKYFETILLNKSFDEKENIKLAEKFGNIVKDKVIKANYIKGAKEFIEKYSKKMNLYICTGTPKFEIDEILNAKEIHFFFKEIYGSPESKEEIIKKIKKTEKADEFIFFGDALTDYNAAKKTNIKFIGIRNPYTIFPEETTLLNDFTDIELDNIL